MERPIIEGPCSRLGVCHPLYFLSSSLEYYKERGKRDERGMEREKRREGREEERKEGRKQARMKNQSFLKP